MTINSHVVKSTVVGALGGLLFGFDTAVISGATHSLTETYHLSPGLLGFTVSAALWGTVLGAIFAGIPGQRFGRRDSLRVMALFYVVSAIGCAFAWNWDALVFFRFIGGLGIGGSSVLGPMYIAEIAPAAWRGRLVGFFQVNIVVGILLAYISNAAIGTAHLGLQEWRWQLGISGVPAVLFLVTLFVIPRSPRWLVTQSNLKEALAVLRVTGTPDAEGELEEIVASVHLERSGATDPLFSKQNRLPVFVAFTVGMFSQLTGINAVLYYLNDIFALAGANAISGNLQAVAVGATNLVAHAARHVRDRPLRSQEAADDRYRGPVSVSFDDRLFVLYAQSSQLACGIADGVHRVLCHVTRRGALGLHQRGVSEPRPREGPEPG